MKNDEQQQRLRRWRLILGDDPHDESRQEALPDEDDNHIDQMLNVVYGDGGGTGIGSSGVDELDPRGGWGDSSPTLARWLGDIRRAFPQPVIEVLQKDAIERFGWASFLNDPEIMRRVQPDIHMVATILQLASMMSDETLSMARIIVRQLVEELMKHLEAPIQQAIYGKLNRSLRNYNPRPHEINWHQTIKRNLRHYQPEYQTIIPERLVGYHHKRNQLYDIILCIDQSASMATSLIYSSVVAAVMAKVPALKVYLIFFDTELVDMTDIVSDPVEILFGINLGGGTNIGQALDYCKGLIEKPQDTVLVLISDLYEGASVPYMLNLMEEIKDSGVNFISLLALNDSGSPAYSREIAAYMAELNIPAFACTPDQFPEMMAAALNREDVALWASQQGIHTTLSSH